MGGVLTHVSVALVFGLGIYYFTRNWKYGLAFFIGHLIPDIIDFGVTGLKNWDFRFGVSVQDPLFHFLAPISHNIFTWLFICLGLVFIAYLLESFGKLKKENFVRFIWGNVIFLIAVGIHLIIDKFVIETNYWI